MELLFVSSFSLPTDYLLLFPTPMPVNHPLTAKSRSTAVLGSMNLIGSCDFCGVDIPVPDTSLGPGTGALTCRPVGVPKKMTVEQEEYFASVLPDWKEWRNSNGLHLLPELNNEKHSSQMIFYLDLLDVCAECVRKVDVMHFLELIKKSLSIDLVPIESVELERVEFIKRQGRVTTEIAAALTSEQMINVWISVTNVKLTSDEFNEAFRLLMYAQNVCYFLLSY